jgi:hypothetical protein
MHVGDRSSVGSFSGRGSLFNGLGHDSIHRGSF